ncbi:MAG: signal recognition particle-docking protein FtsY [Alphaproteobacteria bacterium HGW-Alphaproteobacteria-18]|nr:MAG: signal recognition particle-docking protein FtsY [Alphaproteobacteria bacterium HGW-Alphaproteobacteria-18]
MILWFGKKKKLDEAKAAGEAMKAPELSAEEIAAQAAAAAEKAEIERKVAEANQAWEERQRREAQEAEDEAVRAKAAAELKLLEERREHARLREEAAEAARAAAEAEANDPGLFGRLGEGLARSTAKLTEGIAALGRRKLDDATLEELQDLLITSDMGTKVAARITKGIARGRFDKEISGDEIRLALAEEIEEILKPREKVVDFSDGPRPRIVLFVGVNGSGKTTTIGKIASKLQEQGARALLVAGDTFRAAAVEQLKVWGERAGIPVMAGAHGADAAGLVYGAVERAKAEDLDLVLVDTAGRLQNKAELMSELGKIVRVMKKVDPDAPHDVILVLDATVGQNALSQVEAFRHTAGVTGLVMTKLDGTAKGGVLVAIAEAHDLPIHFIGIGEKAEDLRPFSAEAFAKALVGIKA